MRPLVALLPTLVTLGATALLVLHGPVLQAPDYNHFADRVTFLGIPNARDVLSNLGFAIVGAWGFLRLGPRRFEPSLHRGWSGYALFLTGVTLTAFGSAYYHLAPDNGRLLWDRVPIAVACAGLLVAVRAEARPAANPRRDAVLLTLAALSSVAWWHFSDDPPGTGDLRPYLLVQGLPLLLIPIWQWTNETLRADRAWFTAAVVLYVAAKAAELYDHELFATLLVLSGHSVKHLLAALAAAVIVTRLDGRS